jgi:hypothetical protein
MGLYLCVFDGDDEVDGVEVGSYADFDFFRSHVTERLENGIAGSKCPTLVRHSDSDGEWSPAECEALRRELTTIAEAFQKISPVPFPSEWQREVARSLALVPESLYDSFIDVDGEPLLERLIRLCDVAVERAAPILFQ